MRRKRVGILISGRGSNMAALIAAAEAADYPAEIATVLSNRPEAPGLGLASRHGVAAEVVDHRLHPSRESFDAELDRRLRATGIEIVACAGFMRIMTEGFVGAWQGAMINIHPSLLPLYRGLDTHAQALADGVKIHGCSVHFVTPELDAGPIIAQAAVPVLSGDTAAMLAARVLEAEHILYPMALALVASGRVRLVDRHVICEAPEDGALKLFSPALAGAAPDRSPGQARRPGARGRASS